MNDLYTLNHVPLLHSITEDLQRWNKTPLSWFGRVASLKMNVLPQVLYIFQTVPVTMPFAFFASLRWLFVDFIWACKGSQISLANHTLPKRKGGLGLPDIHQYYWASHLARVVDWNAHRASKDWASLEHAFLPYTLAQRPGHRGQCQTKQWNDTHCQRHWRKLGYSRNTSLALSSSPGPMTPIRQNTEFLLGLRKSFLGSHWPSRPPKAGNFFDTGRFRDRTVIKTPGDGPKIPHWTYFQIRHFQNWQWIIWHLNHLVPTRASNWRGHTFTSVRGCLGSTTLLKILVVNTWALLK